MQPLPEFQQKPDPNQDILVSKNQGPWMILVNWYSGPDAPPLARQMVLELHNQYHLPAYVFNHGAEEKRKEYERIKAIIQKQREFCLKNNLPVNTHFRVKHQRIEDQCAVVVGNYPDADAARRGLDHVRSLKPPDPQRVTLRTMFHGELNEQGQIVPKEVVYVNPFSRAFVVRNPLLKQEQTLDKNKADMDLLRWLNRGENYTLLNCKKPITLAIQEFSIPGTLQTQSAKGKFLENLGSAAGHKDGDTAAHNAHNLADLLHKSFQLEAYVLHTRYSSIVTVGGFNSPDEPSLISTRELLLNRLRIPQAMPMAVPGADKR